MVTQAQALQWAKNSIGRSYDFDNSYDGVQCFDLVNQYSHDLFRISFTGTYAKDLMQTGNVGGFKVIPNSPGFYPQPGDIFVYNYGSAGHTGIVTGNINTTGFDGIDQNGNNKNDATTHRRFNYNGFAGVVRPPFTVSLPQDIGVQELFKISSSSIKTRGWHISSKVKPGLFSFIFIMDANTDKELLRIPIQRSNRPDVLNAYPSMPLANTSGFDVNFLIPANMKGKKIRIVSRYSLTKDGNNIVSDYNYPVSKTIPTFRTVADQNTFKITETKISTRGWHIDDRVKAGLFSFIFVMDQETGKELARYKITRNRRTDVKNAHASFPLASDSGFDLSFDITNNMRRRKISIMSRYSSTADGNTVVSDFRFPTVKQVPDRVYTDLNAFNVSNTTISARGWHIASKVKPGLFSFIFVLNADTGKELMRLPIQRSKRPDVLAAYPTMPLANESGFDFNFTIPTKLRGKNIKLKSRYSATKDGNTAVSDFNFPNVKKVPLVRTLADQNTFKITETKISTRGWHIDDRVKAGLFSFIFVMDQETGKELARYKITRNRRTDVKNAHASFPLASDSGFDLSFDITNNMRRRKISIMSRYSSTADGNTVVSDFRFPTVKQVPDRVYTDLNAFNVSNTTISARGWHIASKVKPGLFSFIFVLDADTGKELMRLPIQRSKRPDVLAAYPTMPLANESGFDFNFTIPTKLRGKNIKLKSRYSATKDGNTAVSDFNFPNVKKVPLV